MWCITLIDLQILMNPCIPGIKPTWSWCMPRIYLSKSHFWHLRSKVKCPSSGQSNISWRAKFLRCKYLKDRIATKSKGLLRKEGNLDCTSRVSLSFWLWLSKKRRIFVLLYNEELTVDGIYVKNVSGIEIAFCFLSPISSCLSFSLLRH